MSGAASSDRAYLAMVLGVSALLLTPVLTYRMGLDQGVFAYIGAELLAGRWPYLETWDHAFPGLMFLQAVEILALGKSIFLFRLFDLVYQLFTVYFIYRIAVAVTGSRAGAYVGAATYALIYQGYGIWNTAQREGFGTMLFLWGFWWYLTAERRRPVVTAVAIGLGLGIAVTIKPTLLALSTAYILLAVHLRGRRAWPLAAAAGAALVAPTLAFIALYAALGGLTDLYQACIGFQTEVYVHRLGGDGSLVDHWLLKLGRLGGTAKGLAIVYVPFLFFGPSKPARLMLYLGYLGSLYAVFVQGTFGGYHYLPGMAIGAVLIASMFALTAGAVLGERELRVGGRRFRLVTLAAHAVVIAACPLYLRAQPLRDLASLHFLEPPRRDEYRNSTVFDFWEAWHVAAYLRENTTRQDRVQVWGHESLVYYLAERAAASRFQTSIPLAMRVPGHEMSAMQLAWRDEFMADVHRHQPPYVVVVRDDHWWWSPEEKSSEELLAEFPQWQAFIAGSYQPVHEVGRYVVYGRRP